MWMNFVEDYNIPFIKGSGEDNIQIACPWCADGSMKLGLHLESSAYGCWKNESDRGNNPARLIKELLGCDWDEAKRLATLYFKWKHKLQAPKCITDPVPVKIPAEFQKFGTDPQMEKQFIDYIKSRGLDGNYVINRFDLRYAVSGVYSYRLVIPVIYNATWWTWVARGIASQDRRYLAAGENDTQNRPNDFLFDIDNLTGGKLLVVAEGSLDAISINAALVPGISATSLFGKIIQPAQMKQLIEIASRYERIAIGLDKDAAVDSMAMKEKLSWYLPKVSLLVPDGKDWNSLSPKQIKQQVLAHAN